MVRTVLTTVATLTAITTVTTIRATVTAVTITLWALTALATLTTLTTSRTLYIVGGLLDQHTVRELVLAGLRINLKELHLDLVTFLDTSLLDSLKALPVDL